MPIVFEHVYFSYGMHGVLYDSQVVIPETAYIWGKNGCGKTTLLKLIAGILKPHFGQILWEGHHTYRCSSLFTRRMLFDAIPYGKQLDWICAESGVTPSWLHGRCGPFGLESLFDIPPVRMSDGMRQWASLAFVCAMPADLYLLDEPLEGLDGLHRGLFQTILKERIASGEKYIVTGHSPDAYPDDVGLYPVACPKTGDKELP